jgi:hypothetical protein
MDIMEGHHTEYLGLALFVASELVGMSKLRSNSLLQLILSAAIRAFPYSPKQKGGGGPLDLIFGVKSKDRR